MTETLANGYSSESAPRELSNEYQHDRVWMVFKNLCICVLWMKVALALEWLSPKHKDAKIFENYLNPVKLVLIGWLSLSTLR